MSTSPNTVATPHPTVNPAIFATNDAPSVAGDYSAVPQALKDLNSWVVYRLPDKVPYQPRKPKFGAKANDPSTWSSFQDACNTAVFEGFDGVGIELGETDLVGIDFDGMVTDGKLDPYASALLKILGDPYCEVSPSGTGAHAFVMCAALPGKTRKFSDGNHYGIEIYSGREKGRYLTITGNKISGNGIPDVTDRIEAVYFLISQAQNPKFRKLWLGDLSDYKNDQSRADFALCVILARELKYDKDKIEKFFSASALGQREKWTDRPDYPERTINNAIQWAAERKGAEFTASDTVPDNTSSDYELTSCTADQIEARRIVWLWLNRIAEKLNIIVGNPDVGKGLITYYLMACVTTGRDWYDVKNTLPPSEVVLLSAEEDWKDTVVPRLMAAGADRSKVHRLKMSVTHKNGTKVEKELSLDRDTAALEKFLDQHPAIRLVVIDPLSNYLGAVKMTDEQRVRDLLTPLKDLADRKKVAVVCVMHLNKKVELDAIHRTGGAVAFVGVARMVWLCAPKPTEDGELSDESVMVKVKGNIVQRKLKGLSYTTKVRYPVIEDEPTAVPYVEWIGEVDQTADDITNNTSKKAAHRPPEQLESCKVWLTQYLQNGSKLLDEIEEEGEALHGFNSKLIQRARKEMGIVTFESGKQKSRDGKMRKHYSCRLPGDEMTSAATEATSKTDRTLEFTAATEPAEDTLAIG